MILSNADIRKVLEEGLVTVDPLPGEEQIDTSSIDLRIGEPVWMWDPELKDAKISVDIDSFDFKEISERYLVEVSKEDSGKYSIRPYPPSNRRREARKELEEPKS